MHAKMVLVLLPNQVRLKGCSIRTIQTNRFLQRYRTCYDNWTHSVQPISSKGLECRDEFSWNNSTVCLLSKLKSKQRAQKACTISAIFLPKVCFKNNLWYLNPWLFCALTMFFCLRHGPSWSVSKENSAHPSVLINVLSCVQCINVMFKNNFINI